MGTKVRIFQMFLVSVFILLMITIPGFCFSENTLAYVENGNDVKRFEIEISGFEKNDVDTTKEPVRVYVRGNGIVQSGARIVMKISRLEPYIKVYWSYKFKRGPYNMSKELLKKPFTDCDGFPMDDITNSTVVNSRGETRVVFNSSTYAGDSFQIIAGFEQNGRSKKKVRMKEIRSKPMVVWKRLYLEQPKVLKNVRFPLNTLRAVSSNLSKLNIEVDCSYMIVKLDPLRPAISSACPNLDLY